MPELPEVETTRRGRSPESKPRAAAPHPARPSRVVYEPRLRWPVARELPRLVAGQRMRAIGRRAKYLLLGLDGGGTLLVHLGMSGQPARGAAPHRRASRTITSTCCSTPASRCASTTRAASAACCTPRATATSTRCCEDLAPEPLDARHSTATYLWRVTRRRRVVDQDTADEQPPGRRRRQHLRERGAVPRAHPPAARRRARSSGRKCAQLARAVRTRA